MLPPRRRLRFTKIIDAGLPIPTRKDEVVLALLLVFALAAMATWTWRMGGERGLVRMDDVVPTEYAYEIDIHHASWQDFAQVPGIGETLAKRIVEWRDRAGSVDSLDDLSQVHGIGPRKLEELGKYVTFVTLEPVEPAPGEREATNP